MFASTVLVYKSTEWDYLLKQDLSMVLVYLLNYVLLFIIRKLWIGLRVK